MSPESENIIERKESLRDLGVVMNENTTFVDHINKVFNSVSQKAGWVLRTFNSRDSQFMKSMWKQLIQLYQPIQSSNLARIEKLMQTFTKNPAYGRHQLSRPMRIVGPI